MAVCTYEFRTEGADEVVADFERIRAARNRARFATNAAMYTLAAALGACLHAVKAGLLDLRWEVLCPNCAAERQAEGDAYNARADAEAMAASQLPSNPANFDAPAVLAAVPPSASARSVMPVMAPPLIVTLLAACVAPSRALRTRALPRGPHPLRVALLPRCKEWLP